MDEKEYLRRKRKVEHYRIGACLLIYGGVVLLIIGTLAFGSFLDLFSFTTLCVLIIILGLCADAKAVSLEKPLKAYDKERE